MGTQVSAAQHPTPPAWLCLTCPALRPHCQGSAGVLIPAAQLGWGVALCPPTGPFPGWAWGFPGHHWIVTHMRLDGVRTWLCQGKRGVPAPIPVPGTRAVAVEKTHSAISTLLHPCPCHVTLLGCPQPLSLFPSLRPPQVDCAEPQHLPTSSSLQNPFFP